jgi:hypothetical protein
VDFAAVWRDTGLKSEAPTDWDDFATAYGWSSSTRPGRPCTLPARAAVKAAQGVAQQLGDSGPMLARLDDCNARRGS